MMGNTVEWAQQNEGGREGGREHSKVRQYYYYWADQNEGGREYGKVRRYYYYWAITGRNKMREGGREGNTVEFDYITKTITKNICKYLILKKN